MEGIIMVTWAFHQVQYYYAIDSYQPPLFSFIYIAYLQLITHLFLKLITFQIMNYLVHQLEHIQKLLT